MPGAPEGPAADSTAPAAPPDPAPGGGPISRPGDGPAVRWLLALEAIAAGVAHEINNAFNGALMNLEVVRLRARPGADAGAVAAFAEAAASQADEAARLVTALLTLARGPRDDPAGGTELVRVVRDLATLLTPVVAHRGVALTAELGEGPVWTSANVRVVRLAVATLLLQATAEPERPVVPTGVAAELAGSDPASDVNPGPDRVVRCTVTGGPVPTVQVTGDTARGSPDAALAATLRAAGIHLEHQASALRFPSSVA